MEGGGPERTDGRRLVGALARDTMARKRKLKSLDDEAVHEVEVERGEGELRVSGPDPAWTATLRKSRAGRIWSVLASDGSSFEASVTQEEGILRVHVGHHVFRFAPEGGPGPNRGTTKRASGRQEIRAPMPGKVVEVLVASGDAVSAGQPVLLFEAMKMQNEIRSPHDGVVVAIAVSAGQAVEARELLYSLDPKS
jgi:biotin carboxyl carrier protein